MRAPEFALAGLLGLILAASPGSAQAQSAANDEPADGTTFARKGAWVLWMDQGLVWSGGSALTAAHVFSGGDASTALVLRVSADRFITDWLTAGLVAGGSVSRVELQGEQPDTDLSGTFGVRVGFAVPIARRSVFWPRMTGLLAHGQDRTGVGFAVHAPFVRQISPGFLVGVGPAYEYRHEGGPGGGHHHGGALILSLAGAFPATAAQPPAPEPPRERFGRAGQWVAGLQQDLGGLRATSVYLAQLSEPGRTTGSLLLLSTIDWFAFNHFSVGFAAGFGKVGQRREGVELSGTSVFLGAQFGGAISVGEALVVRPCASVLWRSSEPSTVRRTQLFLPLALELGHFLLGLGPSFERHDYNGSAPADDHAVSAVGLTLLAAGWWR